MDTAWLASHWYLLFPVLGFVVAFYAITLQHRRTRALMEVMRVYAERGTEPPPAVTAALNDR
jgi:hypothetical protein